MKNKILKDYFEKNQQNLERMYPGIRFSWLETDFEESKLTIDEFISKLEKGFPLQYITGQSYFYNHAFIVTKDVLIPRSETEILVEKAIYYLSTLKKEKVNVLDIGTGSGNIIISILSESSKVINAIATDLSTNALNVAQRNYTRIETGKSKLNFVQTDRMQRIEGRFDLIVSNPPYIKEEADKHKVHEKVIEFEPYMALFLKDSEYNNWFEELFNDVYQSLNPGGMFIMEGHEHHLKELIKTLGSIGFINTEIIQDYNKRDRFIKAFKE